MRVAAWVMLGSLLPVSAALGRMWNVRVDGSGDAPTVQAGIDSSAVGDTVLVHPGTYSEASDFLGKDIVVTSTLSRAYSPTSVETMAETSPAAVYEEEVNCPTLSLRFVPSFRETPSLETRLPESVGGCGRGR